MENETDLYIVTDDDEFWNGVHPETMEIIKNFDPLTSEYVYNELKDICPEKLAYLGAEYVVIHAMTTKLGINMVMADRIKQTIVYKNENNQLVKDINGDHYINLLVKEVSRTENLKIALEISKRRMISILIKQLQELL